MGSFNRIVGPAAGRHLALGRGRPLADCRCRFEPLETALAASNAAEQAAAAHIALAGAVPQACKYTRADLEVPDSEEVPSALAGSMQLLVAVSRHREAACLDLLAGCCFAATYCFILCSISCSLHSSSVVAVALAVSCPALVRH